MGDLSKNISRHEVACRCGCGFQTIDFETVMIVQDCCDHFAAVLGVEKVVLDITGPSRCASHNKKEGGRPGSKHLLGAALDFSIRGVSPTDVYAYLDKKYPTRLGLGKYRGFTHVDSRKGKGRW